MDYLKGLELKKITSNTVSQVLVRATTSLATLIAILLIAYFQGFSLLGKVTKIVSFIGFFYLIVDFGINSVLIRDNFKDINKYLTNVIFLRVLLATLMSTLAILIAIFLPYNESFSSGFAPDEKLGIALYSLTIITFGTSISLQSILQKNLKYHFLIPPAIISSLFQLTIITYGSVIGNLYIILFAYVLSQAIFILTLTFLIKKKFDIQFHAINFLNFSTSLLRKSFPLALVLSFNLMHSKADIFILSLLKPNFEVGVYSFTYRIFDFLIIIPTFLSNSIYPILLTQKYQFRSIKKYSILLFLLSLIVLGTTIMVAPFLRFARGDFALVVVPLQLLALSLPFFFVTSLLQWTMIIKNKLKILALIYAFIMLVNITFNFIFIPQYSYFASIAATIIAESLVFILLIGYLVFYKKRHSQNKI